MSTSKKCGVAPIGCGLEIYTEHEIGNFSGSKKIEVARDEAHVFDFVNRAIAYENKGKKLLLGKIGNDLSQRIYQRTLVDLAGYNLELRSDEIRHTLNEHGDPKKEAPRGQQAITVDDIARFPAIVSEFDEVRVSYDNSLHFIKRVKGRVTAVTIYADGNRSLTLKTMHKRG